MQIKIHDWIFAGWCFGNMARASNVVADALHNLLERLCSIVICWIEERLVWLR
jgi:hypothetical protein